MADPCASLGYVEDSVSDAHMTDLSGKVAFVTGGASGIGLGIVRAFIGGGMKVAIADNNREHVCHAMQLLGSATGAVHPITVDITDRSAVEGAAAQAVDVFGRVHVLVNNAGVQNPASLLNTSHEQWDRLMAVNVGGIFNCIKAFLPHMQQHGERGHVVTTASAVGLCTVGSSYAAYCASKFATIAMMESLRAELCESNIGVSILCPGPVRSNLEKHLTDASFAADPLEIGRSVVCGIQNNDLYIMTHPEFNELIRLRNEIIVTSADSDKPQSEELKTAVQAILQSSIYLSERSRLVMKRRRN